MSEADVEREREAPRHGFSKFEAVVHSVVSDLRVYLSKRSWRRRDPSTDDRRSIDGLDRRRTIRVVAAASTQPIYAESPRRSRDAAPRNRHVAAAASPQSVSTELPRRSRVAAAASPNVVTTRAHHGRVQSLAARDERRPECPSPPRRREQRASQGARRGEPEHADELQRFVREREFREHAYRVAAAAESREAFRVPPYQGVHHII